MSPWRALEQIPGLTALPTQWKKHLADNFEAFYTLCLEPASFPALSYPCPLGTSCAYSIRNQTTNRAAINTAAAPDSWRACEAKSKAENARPFIGECESDPQRCPRVELTIADITPLQLNSPKLGRAICRALRLDSKAAPINIPHTLQIGSWPGRRSAPDEGGSADAVPVFLTIQTERHHLHYVICDLIIRLRQKLILLTPTSKHYDAKTQELLAAANSAIFALDQIITLRPDGTLVESSSSSFSSSSSISFSELSVAQSKFKNQNSKIAQPRYMLRKGLGFWTLVFNGQEAVIKHERGLFYIAWLLTHPDETPIHALDLMAKIPEIYRQQLGLTEITDPETGKVSTLESHARLQERSLSLDDAQAMRALFRKEKELEAILDDPDESEPVKAEALRNLEAIAQFQKQNAQRTRSSAQRAVHSVQVAINRLHAHLTESENPVLVRFAEHINKHILVPSRRYSAPGHRHRRSGLAGCFAYEPPSSLKWTR